MGPHIIMQLKTITYQSSQIFYRVTGTGKTVVLIHGFGEDGEIWNEQVDHLKDHFRVIIPDIPGSGKWAVDSWQLTDSIEGYAEIIKAILGEEKIKACTMIGHSMGGYITLAFAEKYPAALNAFGLVHSTAFADSEEKKLARLKSIEFIKANGAYEFLKTSIPGLFWRQDGSRPSDAYIKTLTEKAKNFSEKQIEKLILLNEFAKWCGSAFVYLQKILGAHKKIVMQVQQNNGLKMGRHLAAKFKTL